MSLGMLQANDGCIDGMVFAVVNSGDYGLGGWDVHAQLQDGSGPVYDTTTNGDGFFKFENLLPGSYKIWIDVQPGWVLYSGITNPRENVTVDNTTCTDANQVIFKVQQGGTPTPGTPEPATRIDGYVYEETCDGVIPFEGARLEVWSSSLPDSLDDQVQYRYSDMSGYYNFHILPAYLADYLHLLLMVPSDMEVISTISPEGVVVAPDHIRFDFPGFELLSGNQFILRQKDLMCETPTPTPTPTITPTPTPFKLYLPIILTRPPMCEVGYIYVNVWGKDYHIPLQDVPYVYTLRPLPWQHATTFYLREYEGYVKWTQYDPTYKKQIGGYEFTYPGGHSGEEFTLYVLTDCGEVAIMTNVDDPTPTPPSTAAPPQSGWVPLIQQDFDEASLGDVERVGSPTWGLASCEADSPPYSIWPAARGRTAAQPCVENYLNDMESWVIFGPFNLTDATQAELTFDYLLDTEKGADWFGWYASNDNAHFSGIRESGDSNGWTSQTFSLNEWVGQNQVWLAFIFESDGQNTDKGVFLDNVVVRKYVDAGPPRFTPWRVNAPDRDTEIQPAIRIRK
ncbi:MAG TPA: hypothetical protein EYH29_04370 [Caldilineales bacterium]|nr:hypothetical protein [Caldilineales bacterium]